MQRPYEGKRKVTSEAQCSACLCLKLNTARRTRLEYHTPRALRRRFEAQSPPLSPDERKNAESLAAADDGQAASVGRPPQLCSSRH